MIRCGLVVFWGFFSPGRDSWLWAGWQWWWAALQSGCYIITCLWPHLVCPSHHKTQGRCLFITIMSYIVWIKSRFSDLALLYDVRQYISRLMISGNSSDGQGIMMARVKILSKAYSFKVACFYNLGNKVKCGSIDEPLSPRARSKLGRECYLSNLPN